MNPRTLFMGKGFLTQRSERLVEDHTVRNQLAKIRSYLAIINSAAMNIGVHVSLSILRPGRCMQPRASLGLFPVEQPRARAVWAGRLHAPWAGADPVWLRHCERTPVLFVCSITPSLPPHSATEQVSLKKKKCPPPSPLCQGVNQTLKRPANKRSYNRGKRLGSYRQ